MRTAALLVLFVASTAAAEPAEDHTLALSVNPPFSWGKRAAYGASGYARLTEHQALRINFASYELDTNVMLQLAVAVLAHDTVEGARGGRILDVGAGWMYFPRRTFDGPMLELGVMRRSGATFEADENMDPKYVDRDTQLYAARALAGWTWLLYDRAFVSFAVGAARGYEFGIETTQRDSIDHPMPDTHDVSEWSTTVEGYVRLGFVFGH